MRRAEANPILSWIPLFTLVSLLAFMFSEGMTQHSLLEFDLGPVPTQTNGDSACLPKHLSFRRNQREAMCYWLLSEEIEETLCRILFQALTVPAP